MAKGAGNNEIFVPVGETVPHILGGEWGPVYDDNDRLVGIKLRSSYKLPKPGLDDREIDNVAAKTLKPFGC